MLKVCYLSILSLMLWGCSNEQGVPLRIQNPTTPIPAEIVSSASISLDSQLLNLYGNSLSSQAIIQDTLGVVLYTRPAAEDGFISVNFNHYEKYNNNHCRNTTQTETIKISDIRSSWQYLNTANIKCFNTSCEYMLVVITYSLSSYLDNEGTPIPAYVPLIFKTTDPSGGLRRYILADTNDPSAFLNLSPNISCPHADEVTVPVLQYAIPPVQTPAGPITPYYPDLDNNTFI